jgi:uncharacterized LabA/DUF88 family protein
MQYKSIILVDGENLVMRYQELLKLGRTPIDGVIHVEDTFVWHPHILASMGGKDIVRIAYYTTIVGDDKKLEETKELISSSEFEGTLLNGSDWCGTLVPHVYKKGKKGAKTKSVDINLTIDALRYAYGDSIEQIVLMSGDGDYIPLLREIMARGKMVQALAFSSGLNKEIKYNVDDLMIIDDQLFKAEPVENT